MHVWRAASGATPNVTTLVPPQSDVPIESAEKVLKDNGIDRAVLVQPVFRGEDNSYVADCARAEPERFAAVCVVDPRAQGAEGRLEHWHSQGCRGLRLRPRLAEEEAVFGDPCTYALWQAAERLNVVVSVLCGPSHLAVLDTLAERFSAVSIVVDHMGHPNPKAGADGAAFQSLLALARRDNVFVKLSGFYHFSDEAFPYSQCWPSIVAAFEHFGPQRLLWGSDFPHATVTCGYAQSLEVLDQALPTCPSANRDTILGGNALRLYWSAD
jgi:predicted TIM-barrel fold metal-dependent hydrolase